jgi:hypothetical protein
MVAPCRRTCEYPQREVFLDYEPVYLDWRLVLGRVARLKGRQVWVVFRTTASYGRRRPISAAGALNWGSFIAAIQGSETQPLALRID